MDGAQFCAIRLYWAEKDWTSEMNFYIDLYFVTKMKESNLKLRNGSETAAQNEDNTAMKTQNYGDSRIFPYL